MAAGLGFKTFTTGEVLTAADTNGYLMQGINVFASTAARDAAITSPAEGQFAFTKDTNGLWYYDGAAWVASGATGDIEGVTAGVGITGGGTSGTVTITNDMATTITASGDIVVGTGSGTYDNLPIGTTNQVLTADTTVSPYKVKWATPASGFTNPMTTTGDTIYSSPGSTPQRLGIGSSGQVLTVSGGVPTWATASAAAQTFTLISTTSLSGSTTTVSGLSAKNQYYFYINGLSMTGSGQDVLLRFNSDSGSNYTYLYLNANGATFNGIEDSGTAAQITLGQQGSSATDTLSAYVMLQGGNSTAIKPIYFTSFTTGTSKRSYMGDGRYLGTSTISSVSVIAGSGTFDAGSILVYGA
jgi:hypothetical protein